MTTVNEKEVEATILNTCPKCRHYSWVHNETGCTAVVNNADKTGPERCNCIHRTRTMDDRTYAVLKMDGLICGMCRKQITGEETQCPGCGRTIDQSTLWSEVGKVWIDTDDQNNR